MVTPAAGRSDIELCLLGPVRVRVNGQEAAVGGPRQMAVLARLMVTPGQVVSMEQLVDAVWEGDGPNQPHVAIRSYVSNLRRAIEPNRRRRAADSCLESAPPGYRLAIDPTAVDWYRFQQLIEAARNSLTGGDVDAAVAHLRRSLSLWRGEPCAGLPGSEVFEAHRVRLLGLRQTALEMLYDSLLRQGEHDVVAAEIEAAILADPLRERLTELGMLAYYRSGRQSDALALGRRLREQLLDELGIDPSAAIDEMELRILNHDPGLDPEPAGRAGEPVDEARPDGSTEDGPAPDPAGRAGSGSRPGSAPGGGDRAAIVGRAEIRDRLAALAARASSGEPVAVALVGEQGIGKSVLARDLVDRLDPGVAVIWGHSVAEGSAPLWPWAQVVLGLLDLVGDGEADRIALTDGLESLAGLGSSVAAALPKKIGRQSVPTSEIMLAVTRFLERFARRGPVAIVLEDLHWADRPSITLLEFAVTSLTEVPVAFVATWRGNEVGPATAASSLRGLTRLTGLDRIDVGPLDDAAAVDLARALDRPMSAEQAEAIGRRSAGNPSFVRELVLHPGDGAGSPISPRLQDAALDRVERLHPLALPVLRGAALFRAPFTIGDLEPLRPSSAHSIDRVIEAALRGGVLEEADARLGLYRFRHGVVQEVLQAATLSAELRSGHQTIGRHLMGTDEAEASYHLSWSPDAADRAEAARVALELFHRGAPMVTMHELDGRVRNGLGAAESLRRSGSGGSWDDLVSDSLCFLSWRARVDDRPVDWYDNGWRSLRAAIEGLDGTADETAVGSSAPVSTTPLRGVGPDRPRARPIDRLERCVLNLIGLPCMPPGPGDPDDFAVLGGPLLAEMRDAVDLIPADRPVRTALRIHLVAAEAPRRTGLAARGKAVREAVRIVSGARRRLHGPDRAVVLATHIVRFWTDLEPTELEDLLAEHALCQPGIGSALLWSRYGYPALVALGRVDGAARVVEAGLSATEIGGLPLQRAEARLLWTRHLLWTGELDAAERSLDEVALELAALDLPEPLPLLRQRRILRSLRGQPGDPAPDRGVEGDGRRSATLVGLDRASSAELAFRLAHLGQRDRAVEHLDQVAGSGHVDALDLAEVALLAGAAHLSGHEPASQLAHRRLAEAGDRLIVRRDGSMIFGPATLWASVAADGAGLAEEAARLLDRGLEQALRQGAGSYVRLLLGLEPAR